MKNFKFLLLLVCTYAYCDVIDQLASALRTIVPPARGETYFDAFKRLKKSEYGQNKYAKSPLFTADILQQTIDTFMNVAVKQQHDKNNWVNQNIGDKNNLFVQKIVVPQDAVLAIHADFHGDVHSLVAWLEALAGDGWFDKQNPFKITKKDGYIVCLGDYTNRGEYGAEVIFILYSLYINNPDNVILLRGNHEEGSVNESYGFDAELKTKFPKERQSIFNAMIRSYHYLPTALFVGCEGMNKKIDYMVFAHGCFDPSYDANALLSSDKKVLFQRLNTADTTTSFTACVLPIKMSKQESSSFTQWLSESSKQGYRVWSLARGHQHGPNDIEIIVKEGQGIYRSYAANIDPKKQWDGNDKNPVSLGEDSMWIFNVAPCTGGYGDPKTQNLLCFDTAATLTLKKGFENWILQPRKIPVSN